MNPSDLRSFISETIKEFSPKRETVTRRELKEVIKATIRSILKEMEISPRPLDEQNVTGNIEPINLPGNKKGGWVAGSGGSQRGVDGSAALGYELTPIGKKDMQRKQDPVY
jgi:hypothetical protein